MKKSILIFVVGLLGTVNSFADIERHHGKITANLELTRIDDQGFERRIVKDRKAVTFEKFPNGKSFIAVGKSEPTSLEQMELDYSETYWGGPETIWNFSATISNSKMADLIDEVCSKKCQNNNMAVLHLSGDLRGSEGNYVVSAKYRENYYFTEKKGLLKVFKFSGPEQIRLKIKFPKNWKLYKVP